MSSILGLFCTLLSLNYTETTTQQSPANPAMSAFSNSIHDSLRTAIEVEVYDATPKMEPASHYRLSPEATATLLSMLQRQDSYLLDRYKKALFVPSIGFRLTGASDEIVNIVLSLPAKQLRFNCRGSTTTLDCDPIAEALYSLGQEAMTTKDQPSQ